MSADVLLGRMGLGYGGPSDKPSISGPIKIGPGNVGSKGASLGSSGLSGYPTGPGPMGFGAGQGPTASTGQLADNPFQNTFNFQIPTSPALGAPSDNSSQNAAPSSNGGYSQYVPLIVVGVIVAGIGYYAFGRKKR